MATAWLSSRRRGSRATLPHCMCPAACRMCRSRSVATSPCVRRSRGVPLPRDPRRHGHGYRQRRRAAVYDDLDAELREASRTSCSIAAPMAPNAFWRWRDRFIGQGKEAKKVELAWRQCPVRDAPRHALVHGLAAYIETDTEEARLPSARPLSGDRRPADGRHERGRRPVRRGQDVPAAGREVAPAS